MAEIKRYIAKLSAIDAICLSYIIMMIIIISLFGCKLNDRLNIITVYLSCFAVSILFIYLRRFNNKILNFFTDNYPLLLLIPFYEISGHQVHIFFNGFFDDYILMIENAVFPVHPVTWFEQFYNPLLTEWMMMGYSVYLLLMPITTGWYYYTDQKEAAEHNLGSLLLSLISCYIVFFLLPVEGPRFAMANQYTGELPGFLFRAITNLLESGAMLHGGAFPSAHCSAATVMLVLSYKYDRKLFKWIITILITLYISTVYGRYHYPLDVLAGMLFGVAGIKLYHPIKRLWDRIAGRDV